MLVNQIQRDMNSTNVLEISAALAAVNKIVTEDMIPAVIGDVSAVELVLFLHHFNHTFLYHTIGAKAAASRNGSCAQESSGGNAQVGLWCFCVLHKTK